jgi:hypothetical protein
MFFSGGPPPNRRPATTASANEGVRGPYPSGVTGRRCFSRARGRMCATSSSVDFIDRDGNKTPGTVRSQIVPRPALTTSATQTSTLLGSLSDLPLFSIQYLEVHRQLYLCHTCLNGSISLRGAVLFFNFASIYLSPPITLFLPAGYLPASTRRGHAHRQGRSAAAVPLACRPSAAL